MRRPRGALRSAVTACVAAAAAAVFLLLAHAGSGTGLRIAHGEVAVDDGSGRRLGAGDLIAFDLPIVAVGAGATIDDGRGGSVACEAGTRIVVADAVAWELVEGRLRCRIGPTGAGWRLRTPHGIVSVLGTRFTVASDAAQTLVSVEEGRVRVRTHGEAEGGGRILDAGASHRLARHAAPRGGLVAHWSADPIPGGILHDAVGDHDGLILGGARWLEGGIGGAIAFDGRGAYASVAEADSLDLRDAVTIAGWFTTGAGNQVSGVGKDQAYRLLAEDDGAAGSRWLFDLQQEDGTWVRVRDPGSVRHGAWHHLVGTFDGSSARLYRDGVLVAEKPCDARIAATDRAFAIGRRDGEFPYHGAVDELRLYRRALGADEVAALHADEAGRRSQPRPARFVGDEVAAREPGTAGLATEWSAAALQVLRGGALRWEDGVGAFAGDESIGLPVAAGADGAFTCALWVRRGVGGDAYRAVSAIGSFGIGPVATGDAPSPWRFAVHGRGGESGVRTATALAPERWHHIAAVATADEIRIYVDGRLEGIERIDDAPGALAQRLLLGRGYRGGMAGLRIYRRALDHAEVKGLAASDRPAATAAE